MNVVDHEKETFETPVPFAQISAEMQAGCPVGIRVAWRSGGAHFVVIYSAVEGAAGQFVGVKDPLMGNSPQLVLFSSLSGDYTGGFWGGTWTHTVTTKR